MQNDVSRGDEQRPEGDVTIARIRTSVYEDHLRALLATLQLDPDDIRYRLRALVDAEDHVEVWVHATAADDGVSVQVPLEVTKTLEEALIGALHRNESRVNDELKLAVARTLLAAILEGRSQ